MCQQVYIDYLRMNKINFLVVLEKQSSDFNEETKAAIIHFLFVYDGLCDVVENY